MKKLIMCMAAVLSAYALNAATVNWGMTDLFDDNYESLVGTITLASGSFSSVATIDGGTASGSFDGATWRTDPFATGSAWTMTGNIQGTDGKYYEKTFNVTLGNIDTSDDRANVAAFDQLAFDAYSSMVPAGTLDNTDLASAGWTQSGGGGGGGGTDIPEPTSGLLLVIGGAMLALRRRR